MPTGTRLTESPWCSLRLTDCSRTRFRALSSQVSHYAGSSPGQLTKFCYLRLLGPDRTSGSGFDRQQSQARPH